MPLSTGRTILALAATALEDNEEVFLHVTGLGRLKVEAITVDKMLKEVATVYTSSDGAERKTLKISVCSVICAEVSDKLN
jgi:hypothetical protein